MQLQKPLHFTLPVYLNNFPNRRISIPSFISSCGCFSVLISSPGGGWPGWWVKKESGWKVVVNIAFVLCSYIWFGPIQQTIAGVYGMLCSILARPVSDRQAPVRITVKTLPYPLITSCWSDAFRVIMVLPKLPFFITTGRKSREEYSLLLWTKNPSLNCKWRLNFLLF